MKTYAEVIEAVMVLYEHPYTNEALKAVLEKTYPEIVESEDKRIRKFFANLATDACGGPGQEYYEELGLNYDKVMGWLEDQKEKNTLSTEEIELNSIAFLEQIGYTCIPQGAEQKRSEKYQKITDDELAMLVKLIRYRDNYCLDDDEYLVLQSIYGKLV